MDKNQIDNIYNFTQPIFLLIFILFLFILSACIPLEDAIAPASQETSTPLLETPISITETSVVAAAEATSTVEIVIPQQDIYSVNDENFPVISDAEWLLFLGDYASAETSFQTQFDAPETSAEAKANALLGLGRAAMLSQQENRAIQYFDTLIQNYPASNAAIDAYFFLGEIYSERGESETAANAYLQFAYASPQTLPALIWEKLGDAYFKAQLYPEAINAYQSTINAVNETEQINQLKSKIGQIYSAESETDIAIQYYLDAYNNSESDYFRAQMNLLLGQSYIETGQFELAYERFQTNIILYPYTYDAYSGLIALVDAGQTVDEYQRGLTDYYAGAYGVAVDAFNRYIQSTPVPERNGNVHHFKAMSLNALEDYQGAINEWQVLINDFPSNEYFSTAWDEIAYTQWVYLDSPKTAAATYLNYCDTYYYNPDVPDFLFFAARIYERFDELLLAAQTWERLAVDYPASTLAYRSLQLAGVAYYRLGQYENAMNLFTQMQNATSTSEEEAGAYFWIGKTYSALGENTNSVNAYESAIRSAPFSYYGIRADEILTDSPPLPQNVNINLEIDLTQERKQAITWMRSTFGIETSIDLQSPGPLENDPEYRRATDYWHLGYYQESLNEFETLRLKYENDTINTFRLIAVLNNHGFYRAAAFASRQILDLSNVGDTNFLTAPSYFNHIRYGVFYSDLVNESAQQYAIEPLLIFSQIRQESLFESRVGSSAGAMGLMQIIPSTGQHIQQQLNWPENYSNEMLFLPAINVPMGVYYLDLQRDYFDGALLPALAAYNAGPGNAAIWLDQSMGDQDLFFEIIRFNETRNYIMYIVETHHIYQSIYQTTE